MSARRRRLIERPDGRDVFAEREAAAAARKAVLQVQRFEKSLHALARWNTKLKRARTAVKKLLKTVSYYDGLLDSPAASDVRSRNARTLVLAVRYRRLRRR
jgi:hypothetical protein